MTEGSEEKLYHDDDDADFEDAPKDDVVADDVVEEEVVEEQEESPRAAAQEKMDLSERRKRQDAEQRERELLQRISRLEGSLEQVNSPKQQQEEEELGIDYSDIPGSVDKLAQRRVDKALAAREQKRLEEREREWAERLDDSVEETSPLYEDFDETIQRFVALQNKDTSGKLARRVRRQQNPAEFAYQYVKKMEKGDPEVEKLREEVARLKALVGEGADDSPPKKKTRLAGSRSSGAKTTGQTLDDASLMDMAFGGR